MGYGPLILIVLLPFQSTVAMTKSYGFHQVYKVNENKHIGSVLKTASRKSAVGCSAICDTSECTAFSYNSVTKECRTFGEEICHQEDGEASATVKYFTKTVKGLLSEPTDCNDVSSNYCSGVYTIYPSGKSFDVFCDMETDGGPWTIITNRFNGSVDFYRTWNEYKHGFGTLTGEYWLGFEKVRSLLALGPMIRIEMGGWDGSLKYVEYSVFSIAPESDKYRLTCSGFSTPFLLDDMMTAHNDKYFSTLDRDNDLWTSVNCSASAHGAWWYYHCYDSNLFGRHTNITGYSSMVWKYFYDGVRYAALQSCRMMLKRA